MKIKKVVERFRSSLEVNKVFFELIVAGLLSFMAVFVSVQANRIAELQTNIMKAENLPRLEIRKTQEYNDELNIYDNNIWMFFNRGGGLYNFKTNDFSLFQFYSNSYFDTLTIPIYAYLNMRGTLSGEGQGLIYQIDNNHNGQKSFSLRDSLAGYGFFDLLTFTEISYQDFLGENHLEYYQLEPSIRSITEQDWMRYKKKYEEGLDDESFPYLKASEVVRLIGR